MSDLQEQERSIDRDVQTFLALKTPVPFSPVPAYLLEAQRIVTVSVCLADLPVVTIERVLRAVIREVIAARGTMHPPALPVLRLRAMLQASVIEPKPSPLKRRRATLKNRYTSGARGILGD